ncbi:uncharacterized protein [Nicotiana sylvestris]|uniref:DUF4283 domain-containing protein n=2 Tax=Nicotiana TaxID=4085 RepID=A0A1S4BCK7_TOBAC|nr:PREDICTED: uncharacterized protein LOC104247173 [Nicotiana sylvestris]XP_016486546.1 PREDICTED: uncharacterized protein LOC107806814 [Nicotiana tabacum]
MEKEETETTTQHIPPKPPDITTIYTTSTTITPKTTNGTSAGLQTTFKEKLLAPEFMIHINMPEDEQTMEEQQLTEDQIPQTSNDLQEGIRTIHLTEEDKNRMYLPWRYSLIIKLLGKRIQHQYLKKKLQKMWKPSDNFPLIDLGSDYFIVKFNKEENMVSALQNGPRFINGFFLSLKKWEPNFVASHATQERSAIWIRLPQLPTEFYDAIILKKIGNTIGNLLKIDACTSAALRGRYARLCIEMKLEEPVQSCILIGNYKQEIIYEGEHILCKACGRLEHTIHHCPHTKLTPASPDL